ncbi:MAG: flippase-like domain-containing protein [Microthrixaceae bacterium]|nr:flippase-like domain-containing protein [Microthrixaceae bacterium]
MNSERQSALSTPRVSPGWERHPADIARFFIALLITGALTLTARLFESRLTKVSSDLIRLFTNIPAGVTEVLVGLVQLTVITAFVITAIWLVVRRRWRLIGLLAAAAGAAAVSMIVVTRLLDNQIPAELAQQHSVASWITGKAFPSASLLAAGAAIVTATSSFTTRSWNRLAWGAVAAVAFLRVLTATEVPVNLLLIVSVGACMGSLALVLTGAPHRRVDPQVIVENLADVGLDVTEIDLIGEQRTAPSFHLRLSNSPDIHAALLGRDQRDYDLLLRIWRSLRIKGFNDRRPITSPRRAAEHEQLVLALADAAGVSASRPVTVGLTEDGAAIVASTWVSGTSIGTIPAEDISSDVLVSIWRQVAHLQQRRIAHRWLNLDSILLDDGDPVLVGFRWGATNADDSMLAADIAELMSAMSVHVGIDRAVESAREGLGDETLEAALGLFQPLVISTATRDQMKAAGLTIGEIRNEVSSAIGVEETELVPLRRVTLKGIVSLVGSLVLAFYVMSLVSDWRSIADAFGEMSLSVVPLLLGLIISANVGGALAMMGSVNISLPFMRTNLIQFAQGFLNRFTPANAGGMALRARYLQREGVELSVGAAAVGLTSAASGLLQVVFMAVFLVWGGATHELSRFQTPSITKVLGLIIGISFVVGVITLSGWGKRVVVPKVKATVGPAVSSLGELARQPSKMAQLFGGNALLKLSNVVAFAACVSAFGVDLGFARVGALYMIANTVGAAVPTPGGVGGVEAALTAALISGGVDAPTAGAIVLVFRLFTFWIPTLPGWISLQRAQKTGIV